GAGTLRFVWLRLGTASKRFTPEMSGMLLGHLGVAVFLVGALLVEALNVERGVALMPGQTLEMGRDAFVLDGVAHHDGPNYAADRGTVRMFRD
ncbi:cytochrome c-type biogenesis CcmF C-terminal domain-containing protein, partial [Staphylococcus arlettae]|uniref:cytochrome c-type biogenesis CcmF C-terminal domain-containing protein n=1 Tax=Staphylococcus arlettae TaxID=29378 RepID=UPI003CED6D9F